MALMIEPEPKRRVRQHGLSRSGIMGGRLSEQPTTPSPVESVRGLAEPANRRDFQALVSLYAPDAVLDAGPWRMGTHEGSRAIRSLFEEWMDVYEDVEIGAEEVLDLGGGVILAVFRESGRPIHSGSRVQLRAAWVYEWADGVIVRATTFRDINAARAAAERLAKEGG
jgi:ketosteroid isomerase-like protein